MLQPGMVSVTFRNLSPQEIVKLAASCGMEGIERGGDVHSPHGDVPVAHEIRKMTEDAALKVAAYGSYYIVGSGGDPPFEAVLESAVALGAPVIRVWAGKTGSREADENCRNAVVEDSQRIADQARAVGLYLAYEFHGNSLTDTSASAVRLLNDVARDNVMTYWQALSPDVQQNLEDLNAVLDRLVNIHAYYNDRGTGEQVALADGTDTWGQYLTAAARSGRDHYVLIEFVADGSAEAFRRDAATLKQLLAAL